MNLQAEGYTREQIETALFSSTRKIRYEYMALNSLGEYLGFVEIQNGRVSFDSESEVMRTFSGTIKENDVINFNLIDAQIVPYMCVMMFNGKEAKFPLGKFIVSFSKKSSNNINELDITGYDLGKIALDDKTGTRYFADSETAYTTSLNNLLESLYSSIEIEDSDLFKNFAQDWEIGTTKIEIANSLLKAMNYNPLHFDENGTAICNQYVPAQYRTIDFQYIADKTSVIIDNMSVESNKFNIPNKWIRYTENPEVDYLMSVYVNDDPNSPYSTVSRGRIIVDSEVVEDIADQNTLDSYLARVVDKSMQAVDRVQFTTLNMPCHGFQECLWLSVPNYDIEGKYIEKAWEMELTPGGTMTHVCERAVIL